MRKLIFIFSLIILTLTACSTLPRGELSEAVKSVPENDIRLAEVKSEPENYMDALVRWGGEVLRSELVTTDEGEKFIRVEVLQRDLSRNAKPESNEYSDGRFVAYLPQPEEQEKKLASLKNHLVTIVGKVSNTEKMEIGKNSVTMPVLQSKDYFVWRRAYPQYTGRNTHFSFLYGSPHFWLNSHHLYAYYPHGHRLHVHGPFCRY